MTEKFIKAKGIVKMSTMNSAEEIIQIPVINVRCGAIVSFWVDEFGIVMKNILANESVAQSFDNIFVLIRLAISDEESETKFCAISI